MTVSTTTSKIVYQGNGSTTVFSFPFAFPGGLTPSQAAADLIVTFISSTGVSTIVPFGSGASSYQLTLIPPISPNPTGVGGSVTYVPAGQPIPIGSSLVIQRSLPENQPVSLQNQGTLWQQVIEQSLDYLSMIDQQISSLIGQSITLPISDPLGLNYVVPAVSARANMLLGFDSLGNVVVTPGTGGISLPPGQQTVSSTWTFTGSPTIKAQTSTAQIWEVDTSSQAFYAGTVSGGSGTTVTLAANPTNIWTGNACCTNDSTIVNANITVTGGGSVQVAQIASYNPATRVVTITGNVYTSTGSLIGAAFSPIPASGNTWAIGRFDYGYNRTKSDRALAFEDMWSPTNPASAGSLAPFTGNILAIKSFNRFTLENVFNFPITGGGFVDIFIGPNSVWNADPNWPNGQPARNFLIKTLQSSGDTGNAGNFPSTYPVTYQYFTALTIQPHTYSGGVLQSGPKMWTGSTLMTGLGTGAAPDSTLEVRNNPNPSKAPPPGTTLHVVGANSTAAITVDGYGGGAAETIFRSANGNAGAESGVTNAQIVGLIGGEGYGATAYSSTTRSGISFLAGENWTDTAQGMGIQFFVTPTGGTATGEAARFWPSGGLSVGTPTDPGIGSIHASGAIASVGAIAGSAISVVGQAAVGYVSLTNLTVATLPASPPAGTIAYVTNGGNAPAWGSVLTTGGTPQVVYYTGSAWHVMGV